MTISMIGLMFYPSMCGVFYWIWYKLDQPWYWTVLMAVFWPATLIVAALVISNTGSKPWLDEEDK